MLEIDDLVLVIRFDGWAWMLLMGLVQKFDETWPSYCSVVYHEYLVWKFMKGGPWRMLRVGTFNEEVKASC